MSLLKKLRKIARQKVDRKVSNLEHLNIRDKPPETLFRFFGDEQYAEMFISGIIRVSTFKKCRNLANERGRDELEGHLSVNSGSFNIKDSSSLSKEEKIKLNNLAGFISLGEGCQNVTIENNVVNRIIPDSYVYCFSTENGQYMRDNFGIYGVEVRDPARLIRLMHEEILKSGLANTSEAGLVEYNENVGDISRVDAWKGMGFSKRSSLFGEEKEYRLVSNPIMEDIDYLDINVGDISDFVSRLY